MPELKKAKEPFRFYTRMHLTELTGLRASTLEQLLNIIKEAPESSIYYHTHGFLQRLQYLFTEPTNDFAYWAAEILGERELGEKLASIDIVRFENIQRLREEIIATIEEYLNVNPLSKIRFANEPDFFHLMKCVSFVFPTDYIVNDLKEFSGVLKKVAIDSIYFHIFEARLRLGKKTNDFSNWIETSLEDKWLGDVISGLDLYSYKLEDLRNIIIRIIERRMTQI